MQSFWKRAILQTVSAAALSAAFCLFALSIFAVCVRAFYLSDTTVAVVGQLIKLFGAVLSTLICVRGERALFKGAAAGVLSVFLTMLIFAAIGGFHVTAVFLAELLLGGIFGAAGALFGKKLRKE